MPIYNWDTANPLLPYANIYDANGSQITRVIWCNTETGKIRRILDGEINPETGLSADVVEMRPAPLTVVFDEEPSLWTP